MAKTGLPADLQSIADFGVDQWYESFAWPVTWDEFLALEADMQKVLKAAIALNPAYKDLITINFKLYIEYANYIYALLLIERTQGALAVSDNVYLKTILRKGVPHQPIIGFPSMNYGTRTFRQKLGRIKRNLKDNRLNYFAFWKKSHLLLAESRSVMTRDFLRKQGHRISNMSFFDFYESEYGQLMHDEKDDITELCEFLIKEIEVICESWKITLKPAQYDFLYDHTHELLSSSLKALIAVKRKLKGHALNTFIGNNSGFFSRILSAAILSEGGTVSGFAHGEPMVYDWTLTSWMELSLSTHYYEYTDELAQELMLMAGKHPTPNGNVPKVHSMGKSEFREVFSQSGGAVPVSESKVMLFGNYFRHTSYSSITAVFTSQQLYYELKAIKILQAHGYQVIYKMHPENNNISLLKALLPKDVTVNTERFNVETSGADAFAFYYTGTTTLGSVLKTTKPILYLDYAISHPSPNLWEQLKNRFIFMDTQTQKKSSA